MIPDRVWLTDLNPDHLRIVRTALEPLGWRMEETPAAGGVPDTPEGKIEIQIREKSLGGPRPLDSILPTLWLLPHGSTVPQASGEAPQDFVRLPVHREEIAARVRSLARVAGLEVELRRQQRELARQIERRRGQMGSLADEVTSRLTAVVEYLELLLDGTTEQIPGPQRRLLTEAKGAAERVAERVEQMIDASRAEAAFAVAVRLDRIEPKPLLQELMEWAVPKLRGSRQEIAVHLEPDTPPLCGDAERLGQAMRHLIDNAHRFSPAGSRIEIGAARDPDLPGFARLTVADTGPGLDVRALARLTGAPRERATAAVDPECAGVGLSIVRAIAIALGGELHVSNRSGGGTRIGVRLPLWNSRAARIAEAQTILASPAIVSGTSWLCRATAPEQIAALGDTPALFALSPGELLGISEDPPGSIPRLGRVRDFREPGSLARALLPRLRVAFGESVSRALHGSDAPERWGALKAA